MTFRIEKDTMGEVQVPADKYWAAQLNAHAIISKLDLKPLCQKRLLKPLVI